MNIYTVTWLMTRKHWNSVRKEWCLQYIFDMNHRLKCEGIKIKFVYEEIGEYHNELSVEKIFLHSSKNSTI